MAAGWVRTLVPACLRTSRGVAKEHRSYATMELCTTGLNATGRCAASASTTSESATGKHAIRKSRHQERKEEQCCTTSICKVST